MLQDHCNFWDQLKSAITEKKKSLRVMHPDPLPLNVIMTLIFPWRLHSFCWLMHADMSIFRLALENKNGRIIIDTMEPWLGSKSSSSLIESG